MVHKILFKNLKETHFNMAWEHNFLNSLTLSEGTAMVKSTEFQMKPNCRIDWEAFNMFL